MRCPTIRGALALCLLLGLAGCSTSGGTSSWWNPFSAKSKSSNSTSGLAGPAVPPSTANAALAPPSVSMPTNQQASTGYPNLSGTPYPVTPYPATTVAATAPAYATPAAPTGASYSGYAPVNQAPNPYAQPQTQPYGSAPSYGVPASAANPYSDGQPGTLTR